MSKNIRFAVAIIMPWKVVYGRMKYDNRIKSEHGLFMLDQVRKICVDLPEVEETIDGFGCTTFRVKNKSFVRISETDTVIRLSFKSNHENQDILLQGGRFVKAPYIGHHGWVSVKEGEPIDWVELSELLKEAYLRTAPKQIVGRFLI